MADNYVLKDELFNQITVSELASNIQEVYPSFQKDEFISRCLEGFPTRELKERMSLMTDCLGTHLPKDFYETTNILLKACRLTKAKETFVYGSFCEYIEMHGCNDVDVDHSLSMLAEYTKVFSAEFAIRRFINQYPEKTFAMMLKCSQSDNVDQRRLASEGLRPKLPWASKINFDISRGLEPLWHLYSDKERYVTRSVANHLNDLSKLNPDLVIETLKEWKLSGLQDEKEMDYIINHACRTLIKRGDQDALTLLGYDANAKFEILDFKVLTPHIEIGDSLAFTFTVKALEDCHLMIDYEVDYPMAKEKRSQKVFKLKKKAFVEKESLTIHKNHPFRLMTSKKLYPGDYTITLQINGKYYDKGMFTLSI